jgi:PknH-like protein
LDGGCGVEDGYNCQRPLTARNNVAVDVAARSYTQGDFGVNIAHQIANKVPNQ